LGRKVHPIGFRLGTTQDWQAKWYADTHYAESLQEDLKLRRMIQSKYADAAISLLEIDRQAKEISVTIHTARPGIVIGRGGQRVDELSSQLEKLVGKKVRLNIQEIRQPELDATLVAKTIAEQIQRRIAYRRAMKQAIFRTIQAGAKGIRVSCSGRLGDAEIARRLTMHEGQVPLHTLRADIDYGFTEAHTTMGRIGVKVWLYKGQILPEPKKVEVEEIPAEAALTTSAEAVIPAAVEAKPAEPVAVEAAKEVTEVTVEEKPAEAPPRRRRPRTAVPARAEEKAEKPAVAEAPKAEAEKKPAKPAARRKAAVSTEKEKKPKAPAVKATAEAVTEAKAEKEPAKPEKRKSKKAVTAEKTTDKAKSSSITKKEKKDAAT